jgi:hypothetical protein
MTVCFLISGENAEAFAEVVKGDFQEWWDYRIFDLKRQAFYFEETDGGGVLWLERHDEKHLAMLRTIMKRRKIRYTELSELPEGILGD